MFLAYLCFKCLSALLNIYAASSSGIRLEKLGTTRGIFKNL